MKIRTLPAARNLLYDGGIVPGADMTETAISIKNTDIILRASGSPKTVMGQSADGGLIHISQTFSGRHGLICPDCGVELVGKKGEVRAHHFAHYELDECVSAGETALHRIAKALILRQGEFRLPALMVLNRECLRAEWVSIDRIETEKWEDGFRPDLSADIRREGHDKAERLYVEICVTHAVGASKLSKVAERGNMMVQINLGNLQKDLTVLDLAEILRDGFRTHWIHHPRETEFTSEIMRQRREAEERRRKEAAERREAEMLEAEAREAERYKVPPRVPNGPEEERLRNKILELSRKIGEMHHQSRKGRSAQPLLDADLALHERVQKIDADIAHRFNHRILLGDKPVGEYVDTVLWLAKLREHSENQRCLDIVLDALEKSLHRIGEDTDILLQRGTFQAVGLNLQDASGAKCNDYFTTLHQALTRDRRAERDRDIRQRLSNLEELTSSLVDRIEAAHLPHGKIRKRLRVVFPSGDELFSYLTHGLDLRYVSQAILQRAVARIGIIETACEAANVAIETAELLENPDNAAAMRNILLQEVLFHLPDEMSDNVNLSVIRTIRDEARGIVEKIRTYAIRHEQDMKTSTLMLRILLSNPPIAEKSILKCIKNGEAEKAKTILNEVLMSRAIPSWIYRSLPSVFAIPLKKEAGAPMPEEASA